MVFLKKIEVVFKGPNHRGLFAQEEIKSGEKLWTCSCYDIDVPFTREQLLNIIAASPHLDYFVRSYSYMIDEDLYLLPATYIDQKVNDECSYFNHSCEPNVGFSDSGTGDHIVAIRDIKAGEELCYHYGLLETESSLIYGMECCCGTASCVKAITFDYYRDQTFVEKYYEFMSPYTKKKADEMKVNWYSKDCYVRRTLDENVDDLEKLNLSLFR